MKFSEKWLREWVNPSASLDELTHRLTRAGLEVESVRPVAPPCSNVVVGKILHAEKHPNADKLKICQVDVGQNQPLSIVCGAQNARDQLKVAVALVGAVLPNSLMIQKAKLRGVESFGMLCSERELGLAEVASGILELPEDAPIGVDIRNYLNLDDHIIEVAITPNRGDCLSIKGLAREVAAEHDIELHHEIQKEIPYTISDKIPVTLQSGCRRYAGRVIKNINIKKSTPLWMRERLERSGIHSINAVVDIMNYVMVELGQPMHAFDCDKLSVSSGITVRFGKSGETIQLLTGETASVNEECLVIADEKQVLALAGIMGGLESSITSETRHLFLESAYFDPSHIIQTKRSVIAKDLSSESSYRFERGVDETLQCEAIERATELLLAIVGGEAGPVTDRTHHSGYPRSVRSIWPVEIDLNDVKAILGLEVENDSIKNILTRLGFTIELCSSHRWKVTGPSFRFDIPSDPACMESRASGNDQLDRKRILRIIHSDIAEEVARIYGYNRISSQCLKMDMTSSSLSASLFDTYRRIRLLLQDKGYHETVTYSFISEKQLKDFSIQSEQALPLLNPMSTHQSVMRTTLWPSLLEVLIYNMNRQVNRLKLFEIGACYTLKNGKPQEEKVISGLMYGTAFPEQWGEKTRKIDFFDLKGDVESLLELNGTLSNYTFSKTSHPALHPGKSAAILQKDQVIGVLGMIHPRLAKRFDLSEPLGFFEIQANSLVSKAVPAYHSISKFPSVRRDVAFLVNKTVSELELEQAIRSEAGLLLDQVFVFDVYQGQGIEEGQKSIALGLIFQRMDRTLNAEEIQEVIDRLVKLLENKFNAVLRDSSWKH